MSSLSPISTVIVPTGALGAGVDAAGLALGLLGGADAVACDAGSTDSGPSYLARAVSKYSRQSIKHDLEILIIAAAGAGVPLLIGSCGTSGADAGLDWTAEIALEIVREHGLEPKIALLYSEQNPVILKGKADAGRITPLAPAAHITHALIDSCDHIVALMGTEPYIAAIQRGANIVLGGRTTDTAVLAAIPIMKGAPPGPAWHAAKTAECGGLCTVKSRSGGVIMRLYEDGFEIEPLSPDNQATPYTVSSHMLYENSDPYRLIEPGGVLDVTDAVYEAIDSRVTKVTGSRWIERPYTMKLEGAGGGDFQSIMLIGIEDPKVLAELDMFEERLLSALHERVQSAIGSEAGDYDISIRIYGWNAVSGLKPPVGTARPREVGVLFVATAATQALATLIAKTCNPMFFHFPLRPDLELPSYGFPFTPAEVERGQVFEFKLNHVVETDHPLELVRTRWIDVGIDQAKGILVNA